MQSVPFYLAGRWESSPEPLPVVNPWDGSIVGTTFLATDQQIELACELARSAFSDYQAWPTYRRADLLEDIANRISIARDELARLITFESGKPIRDAVSEVDRCVLTFRTAAEEAKRIGGEVMSLDVAPAGTCHLGLTRRFPIGPVLAIAPFNFPLNLAAHKVAPALAAGNSVVLKPASKTPLIWLKVAQLFAEAGIPPGVLSVLPTTNARTELMVRDSRFRLVTFTGSAAVGWRIKAQSGHKPVLLELGGNAGVIVDLDADLDWAVDRLALGGYAYAGQVCISVQRAYVHQDVFDVFTRQFVDRVRALKLGDPLDPQTDLGPMISAEAAQRTSEWLREAESQGATVLTGGKVVGHNLIEPAVLTNASSTSRVCREEAFAPVVAIFPFCDFDQAIEQVNQSIYGLQAGIFTRDLRHTFIAFEKLNAGGVIVNDSPTFRIDPMPYGGTKESGLGREGVKYAIEEMTELRLLVINRR